MSNIDLNMILGPEFTLKVVNQSGSPADEGMSLVMSPLDDMTLNIQDKISPLSLSMRNDNQLITLGVGIKYTEGIQQLPGVNLPTGGLNGQILQKQSDTTGDYIWVDASLTGGGSDFLLVPELLDESDSTYFYFGWISINNEWLIQRQERLTSLTSKALASNNSSILFNDAWTNRSTLSYI